MVVRLGAASGYRIARLPPTPASHPPSRRCPSFATSLSSFPGAPAAPLSGFDRINLMDFTFNSFPYRVIFAHGALNRVADEAALTGKRALILSTPEQASAGRNVFALLGPLAAGLFYRAPMPVPHSIVAEAPVAAKEIGADFNYAIG